MYVRVNKIILNMLIPDPTETSVSEIEFESR